MTEPSMPDAPGAEIVQFRPRNTLSAKIEYAKALAESGLLPAVYRGKPANVLWAQEYAESLRLSTMAIVNGIFVIEGKPTASAALISGLVRTAGHRLRVTGNDQKAVAEIVRKDDPGFTFRAEWTIERAKQAGLLGKNTWKQYPAAMLKARAVTEAARDACEEALNGCHYSPEELGADVNEEGVPLTVVEQIRPEPVRVEPTVVVDWDGELAKCGVDRVKLLALYHRAPEGPARERIKAAGLAAKAAAEKAEEPLTVDAELVDELPNWRDLPNPEDHKGQWHTDRHPLRRNGVVERHDWAGWQCDLCKSPTQMSRVEKDAAANALFGFLLESSDFTEAEEVGKRAPHVDVEPLLKQRPDVQETLNLLAGRKIFFAEFAQTVADYINKHKYSVNSAINGEAA